MSVVCGGTRGVTDVDIHESESLARRVLRDPPRSSPLSLSLSLSLSFEAAENIFFVTSNKTKEDDGRPRRGANVSQSGIHSEIDKITDFG